MDKLYLLIPVGIFLFGIGMYVSNIALDSIDTTALSPMEFQNKVMSTDYPIGIGFTALGATCILIVFVWKAKMSRQKLRE